MVSNVLLLVHKDSEPCMLHPILSENIIKLFAFDLDAGVKSNFDYTCVCDFMVLTNLTLSITKAWY